MCPFTTVDGSRNVTCVQFLKAYMSEAINSCLIYFSSMFCDCSAVLYGHCFDFIF